MSLFPAYGRPGSGSGSGSSRGGNVSGNSNSKRRQSPRAEGQDQLFVIDCAGEGGGRGTFSDPIEIQGDEDDEEGEIRSPQQSPPHPPTKHNQSSSKKRKRSRSRSPKNKRQKHKRSRSRSKSPFQDKSKKKDYDSGRDRDHDRGGRGNKSGYQGEGGYQQHQSYGGYDQRYDQRYGGSGGYNSYEMGRNDRGAGGRGYSGYGGSSSRGYDTGRSGDDGHRSEFYGRQYPVDRNYDNMDYNRERNYVQMDTRDNNRGRDQYYEEQRINTAQRFPDKVFLEDVNLKPEFAFRLDTASNPSQLNYRSLANMQKSAYQFNNNLVVMGATESELTQIYNKFSKFRTILPDGKHEGGETKTSEATSSKSESLQNVTATSTGTRPKPLIETQTFIAIRKDKSSKPKNWKDPIDIQGAFENLSARKEGEPSMKEMIVNYNKRVTDEPRNIPLWKEFIDFQDKYFQENEQIYAEDGNDKSKKKRRNRRALLEKKVAICDKALETNPKSLELHLMRLNFLYTFEQPDRVLQEWKKLVTGNQQITAYWIEYFRFACSQLQVYSTSKLTKIIQKSFQKFREMLSPRFPAFQRPLKFLLVINDILMCLSLILRNAGYREKAVALHQAQLELDFYPPLQQFKGDTLLDWGENRTMFEFFWDLGTPVIGENGAAGWCNYLLDTDKRPETHLVGVSDAKLSEFEDSYFETVNENKNESTDKSRHWLVMESCRSKLQWLHWRSKCSDVAEVDDASRVVLGQDVSRCIVAVPILPYISDFDRQSAHFKHVVNFLLTLQEDFLPQTQTVSSVLNPFTPVSLTESRSLVSELFYWRQILKMYVPGDISEEGKLKSLPKTPEAFRIQDWNSPNGPAHKCDVGHSPHTFDLECPEKVDPTRNLLLSENESSLTNMIRRIVDEGIDHLSPPFCSLLLQMYFRFEQKNTVASLESPKDRLRYAKNLIRKPPVRNCMGVYLEYATLEYFEGNKEEAIVILVKTINLACTTLLTVNELTGAVDIEKYWETVAELTQLFNRLAEFYFHEQPKVAYYILALLGSGYNSVMFQNTQVSRVMMMKATRNFEKVLAQVVPGIEEEAEDKMVFPLSKEMLGRWDGDKCVEYLAQKPNLIVEWTRAFAMFQFLAKEKDFDSASKVYEKVLERIEITEPLRENGNYDADIVIRHHIKEQLYIHWCNLGAYVLSKDPMANSKFRSILGKGLQQFPSSPPLLLLFTDVENQMSIAGKLWRMMVGVVKQDGGCNYWAPLLMGIGLAKRIEDLEHDEEIGLSSFGLGGPAVPPDTIFYKLDSLLCAAQENRMTRNCPLVWRVHLKLLALRTLQGKDRERAKATFYEALRHCPSAKSIYLDGIAYFPELFEEATALMAEKNLYTRMPVEELDVLLELGGEAAGANTTHNTITVSSDED